MTELKDEASFDAREEKSIELLFGDRTRSIEFAKTQMWDVLKWGISIQISVVGLSAFLAGRELYWIVSLPLIVGFCVGFLVRLHHFGLERARKHLSVIRSKMGEIVRDIIDQNSENKNSKGNIYCTYQMINLFSSIACCIVISIILSTNVKS